MTLTLPESVEAFLRQETASKKFVNTEEYVVHLIREEQKRQAKTRVDALLLEGLQGEPREMTPEVWDEIHQNVLRRLSKG